MTQHSPLGAGAPVAVGALGGSGTRAVAQVLLELGTDMGDDRNGALDDLLFTLLFKQPRWAERAGPEGIDRHLDLYERLRTGGPSGVGDLAELLRSVPGFDPRLGRRAGLQRARRAWGGRRRAVPERWGWKEPNTHVFLDRLIARWPDLRYVHVVRHGLDMAWSSNHQQLETWGRRFGLSEHAAGDDGAGDGAGGDAARAQLDLWILSTRRAVELGAAIGDRFLLLDYERLCTDPEASVQQLAALVGVDLSGPALERLAHVVDPPGTSGRWRSHGTGIFRPDQLEAVAALGFEV